MPEATHIEDDAVLFRCGEDDWRAELGVVEAKALPAGFTPKRDEGTTVFRLSQPKPDRVKDVVNSNWKLGHFRRNPLVLWSHKASDPPIGKALQAAVVDEKLLVEVMWDEKSDKGAEVARQYREGFLSASSAGFMSDKSYRANLPKDHRFYVKTDEYAWRAGIFHDNPVLLEASAVTIPMLQTALAVRRGVADPDTVDIDKVLWAVENDPTFRAMLLEAVEAFAPKPDAPVLLKTLFDGKGSKPEPRLISHLFNA